ncbi:hypothetical protein M0Q28_03570 [Patescibacteria group bacterium]|jgi:hypothetical protein|nr:hypothetical protein [Patescibacteria group bacterium]
MIPLGYFLIAWLVLVAIFALMAFVTVIMNVRYGLSGLMTYVSTAIFLIVVCAVLFATGGYLATVDWSQEADIVPSSEAVYEL